MLRKLVCLCCAAALLLGAVLATAAGARAESADAFVRAFTDAVDAGTVPFSISCTQAVYDTFFGEDSTLLTGLYSACGVTSFQYSYTRERNGGTLRITGLELYAGRRIADAVRGGATGRLNSREQAALSAAMQIAGSVSGTPLEQERQLHDWLCRHVTYTRNDGPYGENDNAIGALLNGQADCDGYADAFYLLCTLAGIPCRHVHGVATDTDGTRGNHMWNAVRLDGKWTMVDVTWDDRAEAPSYLYFNVGARRLAWDHEWRAQVLPFTVADAEDAGLKPTGIWLADVDSWSAIEQQLAAALAASRSCCQLRVPAALNVWGSLDRLSAVIYSAGIEEYQWSFAQDTLEIVALRQHAHFRFCATEEEALAFINSFAGTQPPAEIKLGFTQELGTQLFANRRAGLERMLARSRLANPNTYAYSDASRTVTLKDLAYVPPLTEIGNLFDLQTYLRDALAGRPAQVTFLCGGSLDLSGDLTPVSEILYRCGLSGTYSYVISGNTRITLQGLHYYDAFAFCETRQEAADYMLACARARTPEFRLYCTDSLFLSLSRDGSATVFDMLRDAGLSDASLSLNSAYSCFIVSAGS